MSEETRQELENNDIELPGLEGKFVENLKRNNRKIREDRAQTIAETTEMFFKRTIEDLEIQIRQRRRDRENMLDLSPTTADSLTLASDFDAKSFVDKDLVIGIEIRNLEIKLEVAKTRYKYLFSN